MTSTFAALQSDYSSSLARMQFTRAAEIDSVAKRLVGYVDAGMYAAVSAKEGIPQIVMAASFEREASSNFKLSPAQGDPWNQVSRHVPAGRGPFPNWAAAAEDAYHLDHLDSVGAANWIWARACYEEELFNGFGYRSHGIHSPYLFAGTNLYASGKYVADGQWSASAVDQQLGVLPLMLRMVELRPALALADPFPGAVTLVTVSAPAPVPIGVHNAVALHNALNKLLELDPPFPANDDNYDRFTKAAVIAFQKKAGFVGNDVDGLAGDKTWAAIDTAMKAA